MKFSFPMTVSLVLAVLMHADVPGQESTPPPPEMKVLERLVGTWRVENIGKVPEETRATSITTHVPHLRLKVRSPPGGMSSKSSSFR